MTPLTSRVLMVSPRRSRSISRSTAFVTCECRSRNRLSRHITSDSCTTHRQHFELLLLKYTKFIITIIYNHLNQIKSNLLKQKDCKVAYIATCYVIIVNDWDTHDLFVRCQLKLNSPVISFPPPVLSHYTRSYVCGREGRLEVWPVTDATPTFHGGYWVTQMNKVQCVVCLLFSTSTLRSVISFPPIY